MSESRNESTEKQGAGISRFSKPFRGGERTTTKQIWKSLKIHNLRACPSPAWSPAPWPPRGQSFWPCGPSVRLSVCRSVFPRPRRTRTLTQVRGQADRVFLHPERSGHWNMKWRRGRVTGHRALRRCVWNSLLLLKTRAGRGEGRKDNEHLELRCEIREWGGGQREGASEPELSQASWQSLLPPLQTLYGGLSDP